MGTASPAGRNSQVRTAPGDVFEFSSRWKEKRDKRNKANQQIAHTDASTLEHEVWHLWLDWEQQSEGETDDDGDFVDYFKDRPGGDDQDGAAASSRRTRKTARRGGGNAIKLGSMRLIIDTGCGSN